MEMHDSFIAILKREFILLLFCGLRDVVVVMKKRGYNLMRKKLNDLLRFLEIRLIMT